MSHTGWQRAGWPSFIGVAEYGVFMPAPSQLPLMTRQQQQRIAELSRWYEGRFSEITAEADRLGISGTYWRFRYHHRTVRAPGGEASVYWREELNDEAWQSAREKLSAIETKRHALEVEAMKRLRELLTVEQRLLVAKAWSAMYSY